MKQNLRGQKPNLPKVFKFGLAIVMLASLFALSALLGNSVLTKKASAACAANPTTYGVVTGTFTVAQTGTYRVWSRIQPNATTTSNNSLILEIDDTTCGVVVGDANIPANAWTWVDYKDGNTATKINQSLTAGTHTYKIYGREDGVLLDNIIFSADQNCTPTGAGANCSATTFPVGQTANIWVSQTGSGSCTRATNAVDYATATSQGNVCTWAQAYTVANDGDKVLVKGGTTSYGDIRMPANKSGSPKVTFTPAQGESVIVGNFVNGWINNFSGADNLTFNGPVKAHSFRTDGTVGNTLDNWDVDVNGEVYTQPFHVEGVRGSATINGFTLKNSKVHSSLNANALMYLSGDGFTIDNNQIYEALNNTNGQIHDECIYASDMQHVTLSRNHIWSCAVQNIMLTNTELATDWLVENNIFEHPLGSTANINSAFVFRGGDAITPGPSPSPDGFIMRYNTFGAQGGVTIDGNYNSPTTNGFQVYGNFFAYGAPCGLSNTLYAYNVTSYSSGTAKGSWNSTTAYSVGDHVTYNSTSYTSLKAGTNQNPEAAGSTYWRADSCGGQGAKSFSDASVQAGFSNWRTWGGSGGGTAEAPGDYALNSSSPLKDIGNLSILFTPPPNNSRVSTAFPALDILGKSRYAGSAPDVGAYEYTGSGSTCSTKQGDTNNDNAVNIQDISLILGAYGQTNTTSCIDVTKDGNINIQDISLVLSKYGA